MEYQREIVDINKPIKFVSVFAIILVSFSVFYYLVIFLPSNARAKLDLKKQAQKAQLLQQRKRQKNLATALAAASVDYNSEWDSAVKRLGRKDGTLPGNIADRIEKHYKEARDEAYKSWGK